MDLHLGSSLGTKFSDTAGIFKYSPGGGGGGGGGGAACKSP